MSCGIYKIENLLNGKSYIGQSIEIEHRFAKHKCAKDDFYIHRAIRKYGISNFSFEILEECDKSLLNEKEKFWIDKINTLVPNGYNMIQGGSNGAGLAKGKEIEQYDLEGNYITSYPSANQASQMTGISHGNICACCREERKYAGKFQWKYKNSNKIIKTFDKIIKVVKKENIIQQIDKKTNLVIKEYPTLSSAGKENKINISNISECCKGKRKTAGGYKWKKIIKETKKEFIVEKGEQKYAAQSN